MTCKSIVAAVVCRHCHDGTGTVTGQYIIANPNGNSLSRERINTVSTCKNTTYLTVGDTVALGSFLRCSHVFVYFGFIFGRCKLFYQFAFRSQNHKGYTKHGIGTSSENGDFYVTVFNLKLYFGAFRASYPIALSFF